MTPTPQDTNSQCNCQGGLDHQYGCASIQPKVPAPQGDERWEKMARDVVFQDHFQSCGHCGGGADLHQIVADVAQAFAQVAAEARDAERAELEALRKVADAARTLWIGQPSDDRIRMQRALWFAVADLDALKSPSKKPK